MGRGGSFEFGQLKRLQKQLEDLQRNQDKFCEECARYLAQRLLAKVKKRTPVDTGHLRRSWTVIIRRQGRNYVIEIVNSEDYASYLEYGHRTGGHTGWVPGYFMMTISMQELEEQAPAMLERKLTDLLRRALSAE